MGKAGRSGKESDGPVGPGPGLEEPGVRMPFWPRWRSQVGGLHPSLGVVDHFSQGMPAGVGGQTWGPEEDYGGGEGSPDAPQCEREVGLGKAA